MRHRLRTAEDRPRVVLCGSMRHYSLISKLVIILSRTGIQALAPEPDADIPSTAEEARAAKHAASMRHFNLIRERVTSAILVVNPGKCDEDDYIGPNAFAEIAVAVADELPVYVLFDFPQQYREELAAWNAVPLRGDVTRFLEDQVGSTLYADQIQNDLARAIAS
ncbi:MAG: hypothetical protein Q4G45_07440 [Actinomycetia bacterium]|nr:hypothetical protein [Actinomycetes bacterium]